jgi:hypothetical protein
MIYLNNSSRLGNVMEDIIVYYELGCSFFDVCCMKSFLKRVYLLSLLHVVLIYHFSFDFMNRSVSRLYTGRSADRIRP